MIKELGFRKLKGSDMKTFRNLNVWKRPNEYNKSHEIVKKPAPWNG